MKPFLCLASAACILLSAGCVASSPASAQTAVPVAVAPPGPPPSAPGGPAVAVAVAPLDELVAPVALYPDALLALVLTASTSSSDVVLAARYLNGGGDRNQIDAQPWDDSIKGLAHYPDVVKWMDENLAWTQRLGDAYLNSPDDVMAAVQRVRAQARANGLLVDTPQQQVIVDGSYIRIIPAQADVIYVPRYDPAVIYVERPVYYYPDPWITFGMGFGVGWWLHYDCDWGRRVVVIDPHRRDHWHAHRDWRQPDFPGHDWHPWRPAPGRPRPPHRDFDRDRPHHGIARPTPLPGAPRIDPDRLRNRDRRPDRDGRPGPEHRVDRPASIPPHRSEGGDNHANLPPGSRRPGPWSPGSTNPRPDREAVAAPPAVHAQPPPTQPHRNDDANRHRPPQAGEQVRPVPGTRIERPVGAAPVRPSPSAPGVTREVSPQPRPLQPAPAQRITAPPPPAQVHTTPTPARSQPPPTRRDSRDDGDGGRRSREPDR